MILPAQASAWRYLDPIFPSGSPIVYPKGLALETGGSAPGVWVTDVGHFDINDKVYKFPLSASPASGSDPLAVLASPLQFDGSSATLNTAYPGGVAVDPATHNVFISDSDNNRIIRVNAAGKITAVSGAGLVNYPHMLLVQGSTLWVAEPKLHRINRVNLDLTTTIGSPYTSTSFKSGPAAFAIDPATGNIWAPDEGYRPNESDPGVTPDDHGRVVVLSPSGDTLDTITDSSWGQLYSTAFDPVRREVWVTDYTQQIVRVFNADTHQINFTIDGATLPRPIVHAVGMEIDPETRILYMANVGIADPFNNTPNPSILRFALDESAGCTSDCGGSSPTASALALSHTRLWVRDRRLTGTIVLSDSAGAGIGGASCTGRVRLYVGKSLKTVTKKPLSRGWGKLFAAQRCAVPINIKLPKKRLPKRGRLLLKFPSLAGLPAAKLSVTAPLR